MISLNIRGGINKHLPAGCKRSDCIGVRDGFTFFCVSVMCPRLPAKRVAFIHVDPAQFNEKEHMS